jgi:hypothetical protein
VTIQAGIKSGKPIGTTRVVQIPEGVSNAQALGNLIPFGWRIISG